MILNHMEEHHDTEPSKVKAQSPREDSDIAENAIKCPKCDYKTIQKGNLKIHIEVHINSMFSCNICEIKKKKRCQVVFHTKREHNMKLRPNYKGWCQRYVT